MAKGNRECGCPPRRELPRCHHEMAEVRDRAVAELTPAEVEAAKQRMKAMLKRRPEENRGIPLPRDIRVVQGGAPGNGKRS